MYRRRRDRRVFARPRNGRERGVVAVETALVLPILMLFVFGIIEFGLVIKDDIAITAATRAGARTASAEAKYAGFDDATRDSIAKAVTVLDPGSIVDLWVYKAGTDGRPIDDPGTFAGCTACSKYVWNPVSKSFVKMSAGWTATQQNACVGGAGPDSVGVYLHIEHAAVTHLIFTSFKLTDHAVMQLEPRPAGQCAAGS